MSLEHARHLVSALHRALDATAEAIARCDCETVARIEIDHRGPSTDYRTLVVNHPRSAIRMTRVHFTPPSHFASNIYDLDQNAARRLTASLEEGIATCR